MSELLLSFYGDDFTGSTDAMESLARAGIRTVLFTAPPAPAQLARYSGLRAFGVAGTTRSMPPDEMEHTLRPAFVAMKTCGAPIVHYKVCSTFDSSPTIGSIGRAIDVGAAVFDSAFVPVVAAAPHLGRYCVFGNLFARCGAESEPYRLDRHPSMSRHPVTPMHEADLRMHLAKQTSKSIGLLDVLKLDAVDVDQPLDRAARESAVVLIDAMTDQHLATIGQLLNRRANRNAPLFVVGSSGVESALAAHWQQEPVAFPPVRAAGPLLAVCGSCSPVSAAQMDWAIAHGFVGVDFTANSACPDATTALRDGRSVVLHSRSAHAMQDIGSVLGRMTRDVLKATKVRRILVAGGDTSGHAARALGIESLEMVGELTRGSPLCRATAPGSSADGVEITFKGGQIGAVDFFGLVQNGTSHD